MPTQKLQKQSNNERQRFRQKSLTSKPMRPKFQTQFKILNFQCFPELGFSYCDQIERVSFFEKTLCYVGLAFAVLSLSLSLSLSIFLYFYNSLSLLNLKFLISYLKIKNKNKLTKFDFENYNFGFTSILGTEIYVGFFFLITTDVI